LTKVAPSAIVHAPEQDPVLILGRNPEKRKNQHEHEDVVHRERFLDDVAGEELEALLLALPVPKGGREHQRKRDPHARPDGGFPDADFVGFAVEHAQIQGQHCQNEGDERCPNPER